MRTQILLFFILTVLLQACTPGTGEVLDSAEPKLEIPTQIPPVATSQPQFPSMTPQEWINSRPFQEAPPGQTELELDDIPEGYQAQESEYITANLPESGLEVQITQVIYERPIDGQVNTNDSVTVQVSSHQNPEALSEHVLLIAGSNDSWEYQQVGAHLTARFFGGTGDGRVWISGPFMIVVYSGLDTSAGDPAVDPMVDAFASLYLQLYPPE